MNTVMIRKQEKKVSRFTDKDRVRYYPVVSVSGSKS